MWGVQFEFGQKSEDLPHCALGFQREGENEGKKLSFATKRGRFAANFPKRGRAITHFTFLFLLFALDFLSVIRKP